MALIEHQHVIDKVAFINSIISGIALYPQVWTVIVNESSQNISILSFALIFINSLVWLLYSIHRMLISLAITSVLNMVASFIILTSLLML